MKRLLISVICSLVLFLFLVRPAGAVANRFNIMRFYPNPDGGRFVHILDSRTLYQFQFTGGMAMSYSYRPLEEEDTPRRVVDNLWESHAFGAIGFTDWLEMNVDIPISFWDSFIDPDPATEPPSQWKVNLGDIRIGFKGQILDRDKYPVGLAIAPFVTIPSGKEKYFLGEDTVTGGGDVILDGQIGKRLTLALNAGVEVGPKVVLRNVDRGKIQLRLGAGANVMATKDLSFSVEGFVRSPTNNFFSDKVHTPAEVIAGARYAFGDSGLIINAGGGAGIVRGAGAPLFRAFAGLTYKFMNEKFRALDAERSTWKTAAIPMSQAQMMIVELREKCPPPAQFQPGIDDDRCPKYYELQEIADLIINCPTNPENFNPAKHDERCQKVYTLPEFYDREEMNIVYLMATNELSLRCPPTPAEYKEGVHDAACPKYYDLVELAELAPKCPKNPEDFKYGVHDDRCQKVYVLQEQYPGANWSVVYALSQSDTDGDGIPDLLDRCPDQKGEFARKGCPPGVTAVEGQLLRTAQPLEFAFNSSELKPEMIPVLQDVANELAANPNLRLRIVGYADSVGDMWANIWISERRAVKVRDKLLELGVDVSRISVEGAGSTDRFASNVTEEGRAKNRRVVFKVISE